VAYDNDLSKRKGEIPDRHDQQWRDGGRKREHNEHTLALLPATGPYVEVLFLGRLVPDFSGSDSPESFPTLDAKGLFRGSLGTVILIPFLVYFCYWLFSWPDSHDGKRKGL
jgi:hypothetical protein